MSASCSASSVPPYDQPNWVHISQPGVGSVFCGSPNWPFSSGLGSVHSLLFSQTEVFGDFLWTHFVFFSLPYLCLGCFLFQKTEFISLSHRGRQSSVRPLWSSQYHLLYGMTTTTCPPPPATRLHFPLLCLCLCCHIISLDYKLLKGGPLFASAEGEWATAHLLSSWPCPWPCLSSATAPAAWSPQWGRKLWACQGPSPAQAGSLHSPVSLLCRVASQQACLPVDLWSCFWEMELYFTGVVYQLNPGGAKHECDLMLTSHLLLWQPLQSPPPPTPVPLPHSVLLEPQTRALRTCV